MQQDMKCIQICPHNTETKTTQYTELYEKLTDNVINIK